MGKYCYRNNKGVALILVLMIIAIIVVVTLDFNSEMRSNFTVAGNVRDGVILRCAATSGFYYALDVLAEDAETDDFDTLQEDWANADALSEGVSSLEGLADVRLEVVDCERKIQINSLIKPEGVGFDLLDRFLSLQEFDLDPETVKDMEYSLIDWIDTDDLESDAMYGAEDTYYQSQNFPYACNDGPVRSIASLRKVKGFKDIPQETFDKIVKHLTLYGEGKININTANPLVLEALHDSITQNLADQMDAYRKDEEHELSLASVTWYENIPDMVGITIEKDLIITQSSFFCISSTASIAGGEGKGSLTKRVTGVVERSEKAGKKYLKVLSWQVE